MTKDERAENERSAPALRTPAPTATGWARSGSPSLIPALWEIEHRALWVAAEQSDVGADELSPVSRLLEDLGLDSLALAEFVMALEEEMVSRLLAVILDLSPDDRETLWRVAEAMKR